MSTAQDEGVAADQVPVLLDLPEVRERLRSSKATVNRLISTGKLRSLKIGSRRFVDAADLAAFIEACKSDPTAA